MNPRGLKTQILLDGGYNYYTRTMRHGGASEYGIFLPYVWWMARTSKEALADPQVRRALDDGWASMTAWVRRMPLRPGASPLRLVPSYERWFFGAGARVRDHHRAPGHQQLLRPRTPDPARDISSSNFPHYDVNPNTGEPLGLEHRFTVAHQSVFHDAARPSHIVLPIIPADR